MSKRFLLPAAVVAAIVSATSCSRAVSETRPPAPQPSVVAVAAARVESLSRSVVLTAEFKPYQEVDVMAKVAGYVKDINVDINDRVAKGQLLATLEVPEMADDLRRAQAAVDRSVADVARANDELQRAESAHDISHVAYERLLGVSRKKKGLIAPQELDDAHGKDLVAEAQVSAAKSAQAAANQQVLVDKAEVEKIKDLMAYTRVTAPFAGVITKRYADTGSMIQAGTASQFQAMPVVRLSENTLLRLVLPVPEPAVPTVHIGQKVTVKVPTLNRSFPGEVRRFADKVSEATRTMDTEVDVENPGLVLVPGMFAEVELVLETRPSVVTVPVMAVDRDARGDSRSGAAGSVMVVTPNNRVAVRRVELGMETADSVEVRSGLNQGDTVVLSGRANLQQGQEVRPREAAVGSAAL